MDIAYNILAEVMNFRRMTTAQQTCSNDRCPHCRAMHLPRIQAAVSSNQPVPFVLPAFPGKSPNPEKVLGVLPDHAEKLSLQFLGKLNQQIKTYYPPGIKIIICSDGRVFSDVVGIKESDISDYQMELNRLIEDCGLSEVVTFNLDDNYHDLTFIEMRAKLMNEYGVSLEHLKNKIADDPELHRMYCGITRFLFEDSLHAGQNKTRSALQKEARLKAYELVRRSNAWSELIAQRFPHAVRLSIHPQACGSKKLGIRLIANESWMTPWHGVAVQTKDGPILLKRSEAEALGAKLIMAPNGRPSHYSLTT